jgi:hypothetical protein
VEIPTFREDLSGCGRAEMRPSMGDMKLFILTEIAIGAVE